MKRPGSITGAKCCLYRDHGLFQSHMMSTFLSHIKRPNILMPWEEHVGFYSQTVIFFFSSQVNWVNFVLKPVQVSVINNLLIFNSMSMPTLQFQIKLFQLYMKFEWLLPLPLLYNIYENGFGSFFFLNYSFYESKRSVYSMRDWFKRNHSAHDYHEQTCHSVCCGALMLLFGTEPSGFSYTWVLVDLIHWLLLLQICIPIAHVVCFNASSLNTVHMEDDLLAVPLNNKPTIVTLKGITPTMETIKH